MSTLKDLHNSLKLSDLTAVISAKKNEFLEAGVISGDVVLLMSKDSLELIVEIKALWEIGGLAILCAQDLIDISLKGVFEEVKADVIISKNDIFFENANIYHQGCDYLSFYREFDNFKRRDLVVNSKLCLGLLTSGSGGTIKIFLFDEEGVKYNINVENELLNYTPNSQVLNILSVKHDVGFYQCFGAIEAHANLMMRTFVLPAQSIEIINKNRITHINGTPYFWRKLINSSGVVACPTVEILTVSAGRLMSFELDKLKVIFPNTEVIKTYGQTETFRSLAIRESLCNKDCTGHTISGSRIHIEDDELYHHSRGQFRAQLIKGEIFLANTEDAIATGDLFKRDGGCHFFQGRIDDLIKLRGYRTSLNQLHSFFRTQLELVNDFLLDLCEDKLNLFIEGKLDEQEQKLIKQKIIQVIPSHVYPDSIFFVEKIPRSLVGKPLKAKLYREVDNETRS